MNSLLVVSRVLHFAAVLLIFGGLVLALVVVSPVTRTLPSVAVAMRERVGKFLRAAGWWGLGVSLVSGATWLFLQAGLMSGHSITEAASGGALWLVLTDTTFGHVWMWRCGLAAALGALMVAQAAATRERRSFRGTWLALALAGGYLASLALVGHSAAGQGTERYVQITADAMHLLAAGAWIGALPGLAVLFASALHATTAATSVAARAAKRFSILGIACVGALLLSGLANAWYLVGDVPALLGTPYGRLVVAKIVLFATMVALAATNRWRLTPLLASGDASALRLLKRNTLLEIVAGLAVVAVVGALGVAIPAAHQAPVWPFSFTLSLAPVEGSRLACWILGACIATLCVIALVLANARRGGRTMASGIVIACGIAGAGAIAIATSLLSIPAFPTSYMSSPVQYTTVAIAGGGVSYAANCAQCHGVHERGDGTSVVTPPIKPAELIEHAAEHRPGDLYWRIAHGIPNTSMPAFSPRLDDTEIWTLIQYLRAVSESRMAQSLTNRVGPPLPITAPDFPFEESRHEQQTLWQLRGNNVLLASGTLPESLPRLRQIEAQRALLAKAGIRVILMVAGGALLPEDQRALPGAPQLAIVDSDVVQTYAMFACSTGTGCAAPTPQHVEWLIDRDGHIRARWLGVPATGEERTDEIVADAVLLQQGTSTLPPQHEHMH